MLNRAFVQLATFGARSQLPEVSPDGRYTSTGGLILDNNGYPRGGVPLIERNRWDSTTGSVTPCTFGWTPDSSGYYFIGQDGIFAQHPGPVRLLLVDPPE